MKSLIGYLGIGVVKLMGLLTLSGAQRLGRFIGWMLWKLPTRTREVAKVNVALCFPEMQESERNRLVRDTLRSGGMTMAEIGAAWGWPEEKSSSLLKEVIGREIIEEAVAKEKGTLFLSLHHGNFEYLNHMLMGLGRRVALYKPSKMPSFENYMRKRRARLGLELVSPSRASVEYLFQMLNEGGLSAVVTDQEPSRERGEFAPFFAAQALTPKLPYQMIQETGCTVVFGFCERMEDDSGFRARFLKPSDDIYSEDIHVHMTALNKAIEESIMCSPEQYQWNYKRFKRQPDPKVKPYADCP